MSAFPSTLRAGGWAAAAAGSVAGSEGQALNDGWGAMTAPQQPAAGGFDKTGAVPGVGSVPSSGIPSPPTPPTVGAGPTGPSAEGAAGAEPRPVRRGVGYPTYALTVLVLLIAIAVVLFVVKNDAKVSIWLFGSTQVMSVAGALAASAAAGLVIGLLLGFIPQIRLRRQLRALRRETRGNGGS